MAGSSAEAPVGRFVPGSGGTRRVSQCTRSRYTARGGPASRPASCGGFATPAGLRSRGARGGRAREGAGHGDGGSPRSALVGDASDSGGGEACSSEGGVFLRRLQEGRHGSNHD